jgi:hypothetical protein
LGLLGRCDIDVGWEIGRVDGFAFGGFDDGDQTEGGSWDRDRASL